MKKPRTIFIAVNGLSPSAQPLASETKRGLAIKLGIDVRTLERHLEENYFDNWSMVTVRRALSKTEFWRVAQVEVTRSKVHGNVNNFKNKHPYEKTKNEKWKCTRCGGTEKTGHQRYCAENYTSDQ